MFGLSVLIIPFAQKQLIEAAQELSAAWRRLRFAAPVTHIYNPLLMPGGARAISGPLRRRGQGGWSSGHESGPFGMAQTGVPLRDAACAIG